MSKRKESSNSFGLRLISSILGLYSLITFLGVFGFPIGKNIYHLLTAVFGNFLALVGLFLCLLLAIILWMMSSNYAVQPSVPASSSTKGHQSSGNRQKGPSVKSNIHDSKSIPLPPGKLVTLEGFNDYFSSPEWVEITTVNDSNDEGLGNIGRDFSSYFGSNEFSAFKKRTKMTSLRGLEEYIRNVDDEESYITIKDEQDVLPSVLEAGPDKSSRISSVFKTQADQAEFLAQFKEKKVNSSEVGLNWNTVVSEEAAITMNDVEEISSANCSDINSNDDLDNSPAYNSNSGADFELDDVTANEQPSQPDLEVSQIKEALAVDAKEASLGYAGQVAALVETKQKKADPQGLQWRLPDKDILEAVPPRIMIQDTETSKQLEKVLLDFGVKAKVIRVTKGPVITRYELAPAPGVKISKIVNLADDIALGLAARDVRIEAPIPGKAAIGIEVPNKDARSVPFREVLETPGFDQHSSKLKVALGKDIADQPIIADLIKMPHLLVAGATGAGKSVCITTIINSILFIATPDEVKFLLVDPKMVELSQYNGIPHLLAPVVVDPKKAASALKWIVKEMENRYELFAASGVRDIERYNKQKAENSADQRPALPFIVVIIDELADLMMVAAGEVEEAVCRLAQMARAAGIHLVIATQRPSVDVITGVIKANIPSRISFAVSSQIDSRTILDSTGAEKLLGRGDMLYSPLGMNKALRVQGCLVTDEEVQRVIQHWKSMGKPDYLSPERLFAEAAAKTEENNGPDDELFIDAGQLFIKTGMASVSFLQRRLKLGYTRAARLMDMLEEQGIVGPYEGSKPRQVLMTLEEFNERFS